MIHDPAVHKLGKAPPKIDARTLKLASYVDLSVLPPIPNSKNWGLQVSNWGMMANDRYGDCTCAGVGHGILLATALHGHPVTMSDDDVINLYSTITAIEGAAFDPSTGQNDNGCMELDVLKYWQQSGVCGHRLGAYAAVDVGHIDMICATIDLMGFCYVGVALPRSAQNQQTWDVVDPHFAGDSEPGSWGGHCIILIGYDKATGIFKCITWGQEKDLTFRWWTGYGDEAYAPLLDDWVSGTQPAPNGFNIGQLRADLNAVKR